MARTQAEQRGLRPRARIITSAVTLMPAGLEVLTIEYKVNFLAKARGEAVIAHGRVVKPGRTITVCHGEVVAVKDGMQKLCATMLATMISRQEAEVDG